MNKSFSSLLRVGLLQLKPTKDKLLNVQRAVKTITQLVNDQFVRLVTLPECFNCPGGPKHCRDYAECIPDGTTSQLLSKLAENCNVYIVGGTIPELGEDHEIYNTCTVWDPNGNLVATHRKLHNFAESNNIAACGIGGATSKNLKPFQPQSPGMTNLEQNSVGDQFTIFNLDGQTVGVGVGSDIRFEEMARVYRNLGCKMLIYPAAFNLNAGSMHWELLQRARANDNQLYVITTATARDPHADFVSFGHSMIVDPWARVLRRANEGEEVIVTDIDFSLVDEVRRQVPLFERRRLDLYHTDSYASSMHDINAVSKQCQRSMANDDKDDEECEEQMVVVREHVNNDNERDLKIGRALYESY